VSNIRLRIVACLVMAAPAMMLGQQKVPFAGGIPVAPKGLAGKPLPKLPMEFDTAEGQRIRVSAVTTALEFPFGMTILPDGTMLVTDRQAKLHAIRNWKLDGTPVAGGPVGYGTGESGMPGAVHGYMDVVLHPQFAQNQFVYISYTKRIDATKMVAAVSRSKWDGKGLTGTTDVFVTDGVGPTRLAFDRTGHLFVTASPNRGQDPQKLDSDGGKVLRLMDDGSIPKDNPFVGRAGAKPEIYTYGHRNSLALAMHPGTGEMWQNENGPNGGDEVNILKPAANYGWPLVSFGRTYQGPWQGDRPRHENYEVPTVIWIPAIALSGMTFYTGDKFPKWKGDMFVGGLRTGEIPGTGRLDRILFNEKMEELRRETLLSELHQRIRDVRQGPDGLLYVLTDEKAGALLKIEPVN
jgi:aldose sugar dehydrogenase